MNRISTSRPPFGRSGPPRRRRPLPRLIVVERSEPSSPPTLSGYGRGARFLPEQNGSETEKHDHHQRDLDEGEGVVEDHPDGERRHRRTQGCEEPASLALVLPRRTGRARAEAPEDPEPRDHAYDPDLQRRAEPLVVEDERVVLRVV